VGHQLERGVGVLRSFLVCRRLCVAMGDKTTDPSGLIICGVLLSHSYPLSPYLGFPLHPVSILCTHPTFHVFHFHHLYTTTTITNGSWIIVLASRVSGQGARRPAIHHKLMHAGNKVVRTFP
jgi:hypothetical protein